MENAFAAIAQARLSFASRSRRSFDAEDILFFRAIAKQIAVARDRTRRDALAAN